MDEVGVELCGEEVAFAPARCTLPAGHPPTGHATTQIPEPLAGVAASMMIATEAAERERQETLIERVRWARFCRNLSVIVACLGIFNLVSLALRYTIGW